MKKKQSTLSWRGLSKLKSSRRQPTTIASKNNSEVSYESEAEESESGVTCSSKFSIVATYTPRNAKLTNIITVCSNDNIESSSAVSQGHGEPSMKQTTEGPGQADDTTTTFVLKDDMKVNGCKSCHNNTNQNNPQQLTGSKSVNDINNTSALATLELLQQTTKKNCILSYCIDNFSKLLTLPAVTEPTTTAVEDVVYSTDEEEVVEVAADAAKNSIITTEISKDLIIDAHHQIQPQQTTVQVVVMDDVPVSSKLSGTTTARGGGGFLMEDVRDIFGRIKYGSKKNKSSRAIAKPPSSLLSVTSASKLADSSSKMLDTNVGIDLTQPSIISQPEAVVLTVVSSSDKDPQQSSILTKKTKETTFEPFKTRKPETCNNWLNNSSGPCSPMGVKDTLLERLCSPINEHNDTTTSDESRSTKKMNNITTSLSKSTRSKFTNLCSSPSQSQPSSSTQPSSINLLGQFDFDIGSRPWTPNHLSFDNTENYSNSNAINTTIPTFTIELSLPKSAGKMLKKYKGREEEVLTNFKKMKAATQQTSDDTSKVDDSEATTMKERLLTGEMITSTRSNNCWIDTLTSPMDTLNQFLSCSGGGSNDTQKYRGGVAIDSLNDYNSKGRVHSWPLSKPEAHSNTAAVREKQAVELVTNAEGIITRQADDIKEMQTKMDSQQSHQRNLTRQVAELQIELTNVKAKERELEDLKAATAQEDIHAKNVMESQRAHFEELRKLGSKLRLESQQASKLESVISQLQSEITLHVAQKKTYDERMQKESQTAIAIQKAQEQKLMILKDGHTQEAIAQSTRIRELENQISVVQSRYYILADLSKEAKAEANKKIRTQSIEVKKMKADWSARSEALAKLSQQVKDEAEDKMKTQACKFEKLKSDWMASSILNTELSNEIDRLKRQTVAPLNFAAIIKSSKGSKEEISATLLSSGTKNIGGPSTLKCQNSDPESNSSGPHISDSSTLSASVFSPSTTSERKKGWLRKLVLGTGLAVDCDNASVEKVPSVKAITGEKESLWLRKKQQRGNSIANLSVVEGESISSSDHSYTDNADDDVDILDDDNNNDTRYEEENANDDDDEASGNEIDDSDRESTDTSCNYSIDSLMAVHLNDSMIDEEMPDHHEQEQIFDTSNSSSGIVETSYYDKPHKKPVTNHWFSNVLNFGNADKQEEGRDEQEDQLRDVKSVRSRSILPMIIL